jgi:hypothetical protein
MSDLSHGLWNPMQSQTRTKSIHLLFLLSARILFISAAIFFSAISLMAASSSAASSAAALSISAAFSAAAFSAFLITIPRSLFSTPLLFQYSSSRSLFTSISFDQWSSSTPSSNLSRYHDALGRFRYCGQWLTMAATWNSSLTSSGLGGRPLRHFFRLGFFGASDRAVPFDPVAVSYISGIVVLQSDGDHCTFVSAI